MTEYGLKSLVSEVQTRRFEPDAVEVKAARGGTPNVRDSLSAFANRAGGGVILLGLDEEQGFDVVGVGDPQRVQEDVSSWVRDVMEPPPSITFTVTEIEGQTMMAIEVQELPVARKPCYDRNRGLRGGGGAYIRVGGTDRPMTDYEIFGYVSSRGQPRHDEEVVRAASMDDLDAERIDNYLEVLRAARPRGGHLRGERDEVLVRLKVCGYEGKIAHPTLAGLLMFGKFSQQFFPQLMITFTQFYGTTETEKAPGGQRFLDNQRFEGPIPTMLDEARTRIMANMRKASLIDGMFRKDVPEYPEEALREALANAVAHRDYSDFVKGSYIQVRMFADRLEIQSPGGLHGNVTLDRLDEEHTTRNACLMRMMEDLHIVENRGSGIATMLDAMRAATLELPSFDDRRSSFWVTFQNHTMLSPDTVGWLNQFADRELNDRQRLALAYLREHDWINNSNYRRLNQVDSRVARRELQGLQSAGLVDLVDAGRAARYWLAVSTEPPHTPQTVQVTGQDNIRIRQELEVEHLVAGQVTGQVAVQVLTFCQEPRKAAEIQKLLKLKHRQTFRENYLKALLEKCWLERTVPEKPQSRNQQYRISEAGQRWLKTQGKAKKG